MPNRYSLAEGRQIAPNPRAPRLGPRAFNISIVNSFGGNFVWMHLDSRTNFKLNSDALAEWFQICSIDLCARGALRPVRLCLKTTKIQI